ncbi:hypothetical protein ACS0TY_013644 [Phlomoides rotata]
MFPRSIIEISLAILRFFTRIENPIHDTDSVQHLGEDEEELFIGFENLDVSPGDNQLCLVGRFISEQPTNFNLLNSSITADLQRVLDGSPWSFRSHPMILRQLQFGEIPLQVSLNKLCFWVQGGEKWLRDDSVMTADSPSQAQEDVAVPTAGPIAGKSVSSGGGDQETALIVNNSKGKSVITDGERANPLSSHIPFRLWF